MNIADKGTKKDAGEELAPETVKKMMENAEEMAGIEDDDSDTSFNPDDISDEENQEPSGSEESSSGEEEEFRPKETLCHGQKFFKLEYKEVEEAKRRRQKELEACSSDEDGKETGSDGKREKQKTHSSCMEYQNALTDEEMEKYDSIIDSDFDPILCGDTLSDDEEKDTDTESEPETEVSDDKHKKSGEPLIRIKMKDFKIPPPSNCGECSPAQSLTTDTSMEVS